MTRISEVIDCWFDLGSMPFAQYHYPFENKEVFEKNFPAQFISEAVDQTRGWFYTLLAISTILFERNPNLPVLGKAYGRFIPGIKKAIASMNQMTLAQRVERGEAVEIDVDGNKIELNRENLLVTMKGLEGFAFAGEGETGVVLDTAITPELKEEGHVREIISKVQNMRKDSGFEVADKITLYLAANPMLEQVAKTNTETIKKETLAVEIIYNESREYIEQSINGEKLNMAVEVVK